MVSDAVLLLIALVGLCSTMLIVLYFAGYFRGNSRRIADATAVEDDSEGVVKAGGRRGGLAGMRKRKDKKRAGAEQAAREQVPPPAVAAAAVDADVANELPAGHDEEHGAANEPATGAVEPRALTRKELAKEMKKREREEMRRFEEARRDEQRERTQAREQVLQKKRDDDAQLEAARDAVAEREAAERIQREQDEFDAWKDQFVVEATGSKVVDDSDESQTLLQEFVDYIKRHKVVLLEDLAAEFNLPTHDAIQRVEALQAANRLTGLIDDRGKFIYITDDEMTSVVKYIERKGRMALSELSKECNKLIRLEGDAVSSAASVDWLNDDPADDPVSEENEA